MTQQDYTMIHNIMWLKKEIGFSHVTRFARKIKSLLLYELYWEIIIYYSSFTIMIKNPLFMYPKVYSVTLNYGRRDENGSLDEPQHSNIYHLDNVTTQFTRGKTTAFSCA